MGHQHTLSIIKPDATKRNITGKINSYLEEAGLKIIAQKMLLLTEEEAKHFYAEHASRPFYNDLVAYMASGPIIVQVLKGLDAIALNRQIMGHTNPVEAEHGTIRKDFGLNIEENSVHGSDSLKSAEREIKFFFSNNEIWK